MCNERIIKCERCGGEGRIYTREDWFDPQAGWVSGEHDDGPCPACEGTGGEIIETQPVGLDDLPAWVARMDNVVKLKRKPRPLRKTYQPTAPYVVNRQDQDDGSITYEVYDERPGSYRFVCGLSDYDGPAKHDAEQIARGLNLLVQYGLESPPVMKDDE